MGYFPMCVHIEDRTVILVGSGEQIRDKIEKLADFSPRIVRRERLEEADLDMDPVFVIAGDLDDREAERTAALCAQRRIPVNVVDVPRLCTFSFPSTIVRGDLTVSVSTGGKAPGAAALIKRRISQVIPEEAGGILLWLSQLRMEIRRRFPGAQGKRALSALAEAGFDKGRPLTQEECGRILQGICGQDDK